MVSNLHDSFEEYWKERSRDRLRMGRQHFFANLRRVKGQLKGQTGRLDEALMKG